MSYSQTASAECLAAKAAKVDSWLTSVLEPLSCTSAKTVYLAPWNHGIGSSIHIFALAALHAIDYNYTVVAVDEPTPWIFADQATCLNTDGRLTHECYLQPLSTCANLTRVIRFSGARPANNPRVFAMLARQGVRDIFWNWKEHAVFWRFAQRFQEPLIKMEQLPHLARRWGVSLNFVLSRLIARILRPQPLLQRQIERDTRWVAHILHGAADAPHRVVVGVHVRISEFWRGDPRSPVPIETYMDLADAWLRALGARGRDAAIFVASDVALSPAVQHAWHRHRNHTVAALPRTLAPPGQMAEAFVRQVANGSVVHGGKRVTVAMLALEALADLFLLARSDLYLGTMGNFAELLLPLRLAQDPLGSVYFDSRVILSDRKRGVTVWSAREDDSQLNLLLAAASVYGGDSYFNISSMYPEDLTAGMLGVNRSCADSNTP